MHFSQMSLHFWTKSFHSIFIWIYLPLFYQEVSVRKENVFTKRHGHDSWQHTQFLKIIRIHIRNYSYLSNIIYYSLNINQFVLDNRLKFSFWTFIHSFIFLYTLNPVQGGGKLSLVRDGVHHGHLVSPSQSSTETNETNNHRHIINVRGKLEPGSTDFGQKAG